jgi:hypothetical protein
MAINKSRVKIDDGMNVSVVSSSKLQPITGSHGLKNNDMVYFRSIDGGFPKGISEKVQYYVRGVVADGFSISNEDKGDVLKNLGKGNVLLHRGPNPLIK